MTNKTILDCFNAGLTRTVWGQTITDRTMLDGWITVHPNGAGTKGVPVLLGPDGTVQGGMGGKFNGQHISQVGGGGNKSPNGFNMGTVRQHGKEWVKGDHHRYYISDIPKAVGVTGKKGAYELNGDKISNSEYFKMTLGKMYYDVKKDMLVGEGLPSGVLAKAAVNLKK